MPVSSVRQTFLSRLQPGQMFETLFESIPGAHYFVKDRQSRFVAASHSFAQTMGCRSPEELTGKTDHDFSADFLADSFRHDDERVMTTGRPLLNKVELVPTMDSLDWLTTTKIPLYGKDGSIIGLAGITRRTRDSDTVYLDHPEMHRIVDFIRERFREKLTLADMARVGGISVSSLERLFRRIFGLTPLKYLRKTRLNAACRRLRDSAATISEIAADCGFGNQTNLTRAFRAELKITPLKYRRRFSGKTLVRGNGNNQSPQRNPTPRTGVEGTTLP